MHCEGANVLGTHGVFISHDTSGWSHNVGIAVIMRWDPMMHWDLMIYCRGVGITLSKDVTGNMQIYAI